MPTLNGPAQAWFSADGSTAFVVSQKGSAVDVFAVDSDPQGFSRPRKLSTLDIAAQDKFGFTPFLKTSPDAPGNGMAGTAPVWASSTSSRSSWRLPTAPLPPSAAIQGHPTLVQIFEPLLMAREALREQLLILDKRVGDAARADRVCRRLMSAPGVGAIVAMTFRAAVDQPG